LGAYNHPHLAAIDASPYAKIFTRGKFMARRTSQQWHKLIQEQAASGQTATAFCTVRGINDKYFSLWKNRLYPKTKKTPQTESHFIALKTPAIATDAFSLSIGSVMLKIPANTSPQWVATLIRELS
jgi:hypothetical protein